MQETEDPEVAEEDEEDLSYLDDEDDTNHAFERFHDTRAETKKQKRRTEAVKTLTAGSEELGSGRETTYKPSRHEKVWLEESLGSFYDQSLLSDVLFRSKAEKKPTVTPASRTQLSEMRLDWAGWPRKSIGPECSGTCARTLSTATDEPF